MDISRYMILTFVSVVVFHVLFSETYNIVLVHAHRSEARTPYMHPNYDMLNIYPDHDILMYVTAPLIAANLISMCLILMTFVFANPQQDVVYTRSLTLLGVTAGTIRTAAAAAA